MKKSKKEDPPVPTAEQLGRARALFEEIEPRGLFYRAASELVAASLEGRSDLTVAESIAVLLQTWNFMFYRFKRHTFDAAHFEKIEALLTVHDDQLRQLRSRRLISLEESEFDGIARLFTDFDFVLGPVGAAKALHLLAPDFFPLWDKEIASGYGVYLGNCGENAVGYVTFMTIAASQLESLGSDRDTPGILKRIDEFNYCWFTQKLSSAFGPA